MNTVAQILGSKPDHTVYAMGPGTSAHEAVRLMAEKNIGASDECMALMTQNRMRHLLVMDGGQLIGLLSIGDLVKATICEQQFIIEQLEHYIT
jgi:CBS domain-containing protein